MENSLVRKTLLQIETLHSEGGRNLDRPLRMIAAIAVMKNPWAGEEFVEDLGPEIDRHAPKLGELLTGMIMSSLAEGECVEAHGKAAIVGISGEIEHASALIHTLKFGNIYRFATEAKTFLPFTNIRGACAAPIMIPLTHTVESGRRSHYLTMQTAVPDAPGPVELVVALGASTTGRPFHRIGDRHQELDALGHSRTNPAGVKET